MLMQNLGGQTKSIMVFSELAYSTFSRRPIQKGIYVLVADHPFLHLLMLQDQEFR